MSIEPNRLWTEILGHAESPESHHLIMFTACRGGAINKQERNDLWVLLFSDIVPTKKTFDFSEFLAKEWNWNSSSPRLSSPVVIDQADVATTTAFVVCFGREWRLV